MIFGIMGPMGSGKQTIAQHFEKFFGFQVINLPEKFKEEELKQDKISIASDEEKVNKTFEEAFDSILKQPNYKAIIYPITNAKQIQILK